MGKTRQGIGHAEKEIRDRDQRKERGGRQERKTQTQRKKER